MFRKKKTNFPDKKNFEKNTTKKNGSFISAWYFYGLSLVFL